MSQKTTKLFLILASMILALSCSSPLGDEGTGGGSDGGSGGGSGGGGTITNEYGKVFPAWYLTEQQQQQDFSMGPTILFDTKNSGGAVQHYRIPAIIVADNGNIIAIADNRYNHGGDIGVTTGLIDVVYKVSKDGGNNWSAEKILGNKSTSSDRSKALSKGDPLVFKANDGDLVCMAVAGGGFGNATDSTPSRMVRSVSTDNGETWSSWVDVGESLIKKIKTKFGAPKAFAPSGRGLTLKDGTFAAAMIGATAKNALYGLYIYSRDKGQTWDCADNRIDSTGGNGNWNEPKVIAELNDGKLLMSVRNGMSTPTKNDPRMYAVSTDAPVNGKCSWPNALSAWTLIRCGGVDAEGVVWTREREQDKNRMLHIQAGPYGRHGLKLFLSTTEGRTDNSWTEAKEILARNSGGACYSSLDVCGDGTIVTLAEEASKNGGTYDIVFRRYNMKAITGEVYKTSWYK